MFRSLVFPFALVASIAFAAPEKSEFETGGLKALELTTTSGDVKIGVSDDAKAHVSADKQKFGENCSMKVERSGEKLVVEVRKGSAWTGGECKVDFDIRVPKKIALLLKYGSGDLDVTGTQGKVDFTVGSGDVKVDADVDALDGRTGSGSVDVSGLRGNVDLKTGSGTIKLAYRANPAQAQVEIKTGSGDATVIVPPTTKVVTDFHAGSGAVHNELGETAGAPFKVTMRSGSGSLTVKKR